MSEQNLFELYSQKILALTTEIPHQAPIEGANGCASKRSPICGSEVSVELLWDGAQIVAYSQKVRACALGQASSAIFGAAVIGRSAAELEALHAELTAFLKEGGALPSAPFDGYEVLRPAQDHPHRHASILLPVDATLAAIADAKSDRA